MPDFDKIHQRPSVKCRMVNEARHCDLALDGLDAQHGAGDIRPRLMPHLGLSCGKGHMLGKSVFLFYQLELGDYDEEDSKYLS